MSAPSYFRVYNASAGSGKTFTLVREYLALLLNPARSTGFQRILAITFTNKAAGEMKDRVLQYLVEFATSDPGQTDDMKTFLLEETGQTAPELKERSLQVLQQILRDYGSFNIKTIDSFTNKLIKSFAFDLGLSMDFEVELDTDSIFQEAVDELISRIGQDGELTKILVSFARQKTEEDKSWDISRDLLEISHLLLNENHLQHLETLQKKKISDFRALHRALTQERKEIQLLWKDFGKRALDLIGSKGLVAEDFYRKQVPSFFAKLIRGGSAIEFEKGSSIERNLESGQLYAKSQRQEAKDAIDGISEELVALYRESESLFEAYSLYGLILNNLVPLAVLNSIYRILEEIKTENNMRLNAEFNQLISKHLRDQPAAFIYERIGEKFKYFFIDEMQDTSVLQWLNLIPLLSNALSGERAGLMLVGDAKQAIYRWRGGRAEQFIELSFEQGQGGAGPFVVEKEVRNLETNYRSFSEVIRFNNDLFAYLSGLLSQNTYQDLYKAGSNQKQNSKAGGLVELDFLDPMSRSSERDEAYPAAVLDKVKKVLEDFEPQEICILVRKKSQGAAVAKVLSENGIDIQSSETLLLKNNRKVAFIIDFLRFQEDPNNREALFEVLTFLHDHWQVDEPAHDFYQRHLHLGFEELLKSFEAFGVEYAWKRLSTYSVYEGVEAIIGGFGLNEGSDAFLQFFLDFVFDYTQRRSQKGIGFLEFWEEKKDKTNIVSSADAKAVRIMTIHKSKGLEFPVVIFPYDMEIYGDRSPVAWYEPLEGEVFQGFEALLVNATSRIQKTGQRGIEIFEELQTEQELDSANLLYVCLTRAIERLYVISEIRKPQDKPKYISQVLTEYLKQKGIWEEGRSSYAFGTEERSSRREALLPEGIQQEELISSSWQDHDLHLESKASLLWDTERGEAIEYGNLIHEMMAGVIVKSDLISVIQASVNAGYLHESDSKAMLEMLEQLVGHPELSRFYQPGLRVINERPIVGTDAGTLVPDRLVFEEKKVWIIDYKTGMPENSHRKQLDQYASALVAMGFEVQDRILAYIGKPVQVIKIED